MTDELRTKVGISAIDEILRNVVTRPRMMAGSKDAMEAIVWTCLSIKGVLIDDPDRVTTSRDRFHSTGNVPLYVVHADMELEQFGDFLYGWIDMFNDPSKGRPKLGD